MKTITTQEAARRFEDVARLAHQGERILVTRNGKPWVVLSPPALPIPDQTVAQELQWPDFAARLAPYYSEPITGPTATELLSQDKEDRF